MIKATLSTRPHCAAGGIVMQFLFNTSAPQVRGAHDAEFVCVDERAYLVAEANDVKAGDLVIEHLELDSMSGGRVLAPWTSA